MPEYRIVALQGQREWQGRFGPMRSYDLTVADASGQEITVELNQKPETPAPGFNQVLSGTIEQRQVGDRVVNQFKKEARPAQGRRDDPARDAKITRMHSQEMALRFAAASGDLKDLDLASSETVGAVLNGPIRRLADWFERDALRTSSPQDGRAAAAPPRQAPPPAPSDLERYSDTEDLIDQDPGPAEREAPF